MLKKVPIGFRIILNFKYLVLFLYVVAIVAANALVCSLLAGFLLAILYLIAMIRIVCLYFSNNSGTFKKIVYVFFVLVFVHMCLGVNVAYVNWNMHREKREISEVSSPTFISDEDNIAFFDKPYFSSGIYVCSTDFTGEKLLDCSLKVGKAAFLCSKIYKDMKGSDLSFAVTYYPETIQGFSKFNLIFQLLDPYGKDLGMLTYVLYGTTDHYFRVNKKFEERVYATYIINPVEKEWKTLKVDSIINDYNAVATKVNGKLWDELNVEKIKVIMNSWSAEGGTMSVYLKGLEVKKKYGVSNK